MFAKTTLVSALAGLAAALPAPAAQQARDTSPNVFTAITIHSGDINIHLHNIQASGSRFYLNKASSASCPDIPQIDCSNYENSATVFAYGTTGQAMSLYVGVPGGQLIYVAPNGELGYTIAHSGSYPAGSGLSPFEYTPQTRVGSVGTLTFENGNFYACPVEGQESVYQVFAAAYGDQEKYVSECTEFLFATSEWDGKAAWQY